MRFLVFIFVFLSSVFGFNINSVDVYKNSIKFGISEADYTVGEVFDSSLMQCKPKLNGIFHLENSDSLVFYSKKNLPTSTLYNCKMDGLDINFESDEFKVIKFESIKNDSFFVSFNDDVASVEKYIKLSNEKLKFRVSKIDESSFIIDVNNPNNLKYDILLTSNLKSINGATLKQEIKLSQISTQKNENMETLVVDINLVEGIAYPGKILGFRLYFENYTTINSLIIDGEDVKNFSVIETNFVEKDGKSYYYTDIISKDFKPKTKYNITLLAGFGQIYDDWGSVIKDDIKFSFTTPDYIKEVRFLDDKPYISNKGGAFINSINVGEIKTMLSKVDDENIRYFLNFSEGNESFSEYKTKNFTLDMVPNEDINSTIKFDELKDGIYKFDIFYRDKDELKNVTKYLYFGDIAVHAKVFNDSIFVFLNRLSNNEVISEAKITLFSDKNKVILTGKSKDDGTFAFDKKDLLKEKPKSLFVEFKDERNFLIFNEKNGEFENLYKKSSLKTKAYVYLASDIIRPNTKLQGSVILKENFKSLKNLPINIKIFDPKNNKIYDVSKNSDEYGTIKLDIKDNFELNGKYSLKVIFEDKILTTKEFSVESFVAQSLKANVKFSKDAYKNSESLGLNLGAAYLFGQNASNLNANLSVSINNSTFENEKFKEYKFDDDSVYASNIFNYNAPILLDENGSLTFLINPNFKTKLNSKLEVNANFMVNDGGKSSSDYSKSVIYPYDSIVGVSKENQNFKFVSINPITLKDTNSTLKATLYEEFWNYNFNEKGYISWFSTYKIIEEFDIKDNFLSAPNLPDGAYKLSVKDLNSTHESAIRFSVGSTLIPTDNLNLANITLDKKTYKKGDTITANISSPLKDALFLVTLEDEKVLNYQIIKVDNHSAVAKFDIKDDFGGMYLSAKALRVADMPNYFLPFKAENSVYIAKDNFDKKLKLEMNLPNVAKSSQDIEVSIKTAPSSKVYLFAVDYGVLNIVNQKSPQIFEFFSTIKEKTCTNFDIYNELTHFKTGGKTLSFGSDAGAMLMGMKKYMDPLEDRENYIKMFDSISDENGTAKFSLNVPMNTKVRVDVIAINDEKINETSKDIIIKDDILVKMPNILYLLKGDSVELPFRVFNNTNKDKTINLDINSSSNLSINDINKSIVLEPNSFKTLNLEVIAKDIGKASIKVLDKSLNFKILPNSSLNTKVINGILDGNKTISLNDTYKTAKLSISSSPTALFLDDKEKLINYAYGCSEQISSKLLAMLYTKPKDEKEAKDREIFINNGIKILEAKQKSDGNFGYWDSESLVNDYASVYATDTLLTLKENGFEISDLVIKKALNALSNKGMSDRLSDIYAAYLLSEQKLLASDKINIFYDKKYYKKSLVSHYMMAVILKNARLNKELEVVKNEINSYKFSKFEPDFDGFSSQIRDLSFAMYLDLKHFGGKNNSLFEKIISLKDTISSTQDRAVVLRAMNELGSNEKVKAKVQIGNDIYLLNGDENLDLNLTSKSINLSSQNSKSYFSLVNYGYEELPLKHEFVDKTLNIYREFVDMDGNSVNLDDIRLNDTIFAKITLNSKADYEDILVHQKAPSCFEIVNERIVQNIRTSAQTNTINSTYTDINDVAITNFLEPVYNGSEVIFYTPFRAVLKGNCALPEVRAERMYDEKVNDYDLERNFIEIK